MIQSVKYVAALAWVFTLSAAVSADSTSGTVKSVDTGRNEVVLKGLVKDTVYELEKDAAVGLDGKFAKLADLKEGDKVTITYLKRGDRLMASEVRALRYYGEASGTVRDIFADKKEITLKGTIKDTTYELEKEATCWLNGKKSALKDIRAGDQVLVTYQEKGAHRMAIEVRATRK